MTRAAGTTDSDDGIPDDHASPGRVPGPRPQPGPATRPPGSAAGGTRVGAPAPPAPSAPSGRAATTDSTTAAPLGRATGRASRWLVAWWLLVAACGLVGFGDVALRLGDPVAAAEDLSHLASLAAGLLYFGLAVGALRARGTGHGVGGPVAGWLRGALTVTLLLVGVVWHTLMDGLADGYLTVSALFTHLLTPLVVLVDWLLVGRGHVRTRWWYPLSWTVPLLGYLVFMVLAEVDSYRGFLDPDSDDFLATVGGFTAAVVVTGYVLLAGVAAVARVSGVSRADVAPRRRADQRS